MPYMLLVLEPSDDRDGRSPAVVQQRFEQMMAYRDALKARGLYLASDSLDSDRRGVRVTRRESKRRVIDGPFAEAREIVGGYFLVDCATREQAIELAHECPACGWGTVEVRQVRPCNQRQEDAAAA